jgi:hypothetical protein
MAGIPVSAGVVAEHEHIPIANDLEATTWGLENHSCHGQCSASLQRCYLCKFSDIHSLPDRLNSHIIFIVTVSLQPFCEIIFITMSSNMVQRVWAGKTCLEKF